MATSHTLRDNERQVLLDALRAYQGALWPRDKDTWTDVTAIYQIIAQARAIVCVKLGPHDRPVRTASDREDDRGERVL